MLFLPALLILGCDSDSNSDIEDYSGTYTGDAIYRAEGQSEIVFVGLLEMKVVQSGKEITVMGTQSVYGEIEKIEQIKGTVNSTGFATMTGGGFSTDRLQSDSCGEVTLRNNEWVFSVPNLRISQSYRVQGCGGLAMSALLVRK